VPAAAGQAVRLYWGASDPQVDQPSGGEASVRAPAVASAIHAATARRGGRPAIDTDP
jgi:hypothetical protein